MPKYVYSDVICYVCEKICKSTGFHVHLKSHGDLIYQEYKESQKRPITFTKLSDNEFICPECPFVSKTQQSVSSHWWRKHTEKGQKHKSIPLGTKFSDKRVFKLKLNLPRHSWNLGLTKETDKRVAKTGLTLSGKIKSGEYVPYWKGKHHTDEAKKNLSLKLSINNKGGRSKWYEVAGQKVQGTWERDIALKLEEYGIKWEKLKVNRHTFDYIMDGQCRSYTPDFYLPEFDIYVEVKGFWWGDDKRKMQIVMDTYPYSRVIIVEFDDYKKIIEMSF